MTAIASKSGERPGSSVPPVVAILDPVRAAGSDENIRLIPPRRMTLEESLEFLAPDELLEVTPRSLRLRKAVLDPGQRKRVERGKEPR